MFSSLVCWFGRGAGSGRSRRGAGSAPRFTPQLEALETRALPGGAPGGVLGDFVGAALRGALVSSPAHVALPGSKVVGVGHGTLFGYTVQVSRSTGEEIPQT